MTLQLDLKPETERSLRAAAEARHVPVEDYLVSLVESALDPAIIPAENPARSPQEAHAWLERLSRFSKDIPLHPGETWSRETLYEDHD